MRRAMFVAGIALAVAWVAAVTVSVSRQPPPGEANRASLTAAFQRAVTYRDERAVERLLHKPPDGTAERLVDGCGRDPTGCRSLPIAEHDGRWFIDPWAAVLARPG